MTLNEKLALMMSGDIYDPGDGELMEYQFSCVEKVNLYNQTSALPEGLRRRTAMLEAMFESIGEGSYIEPPFHANWGGHHVRIGSSVYVNFNLTLVDDGPICIGDHAMLGPNVTIATACHPIDPKLRELGLQYNRPVYIKRNVWIGAGAIILPGVTIGENCVIGAGAVVTRDIPENTIAFGNPCRVKRNIHERDELYDAEISPELVTKISEKIRPEVAV